MATKTEYLPNHRVEHEGKVWHVDASIQNGRLCVYRTHGDVSDMDLLRAALQLEADVIGLSLLLSD